MIGQVKLTERLSKLLNNFPKFSIFIGPKGSGKKLIIRETFSKMSIPVFEFDTKIESVRNVITLAYEQRDPICYMFPDADGMSLNAKNALLKVTEEPPQNAYFVLTLLDKGNTLETILSRGSYFQLDPYTKDELLNYVKYKRYNESFNNLILDICSNTGQIDELFSYDVKAFYTFAQTIVNNIHIPTTGNIFKISKQVKSKDSDQGYDATLLFTTVLNLYLKKAKETNKIQYYNACNVTAQCLRDLSLSNVSKIGTVDNWIMDVRRVLQGI